MIDKATEYVKTDDSKLKLIRLELWLSPVLIITPIVISILLLWNWYLGGYIGGSPVYNGELMLALIILIGNLIFDVPLIKSLFKRDDIYYK